MFGNLVHIPPHPQTLALLEKLEIVNWNFRLKF